MSKPELFYDLISREWVGETGSPLQPKKRPYAVQNTHENLTVSLVRVNGLSVEPVTDWISDVVIPAARLFSTVSGVAVAVASEFDLTSLSEGKIRFGLPLQTENLRTDLGGAGQKEYRFVLELRTNNGTLAVQVAAPFLIFSDLMLNGVPPEEIIDNLPRVVDLSHDAANGDYMRRMTNGVRSWARSNGGGGLTNINDFDHPVMGVYPKNGLNVSEDTGMQCLSLDVGEGLKTMGNAGMGELLRLVVDKAELGLLIKLRSFTKYDDGKSWLYDLTYFNGLKDAPAVVFANPDDYNGGGTSTLSSYMPSYETGKGLLIVASIDSGVLNPENSSQNRMDSTAFFLSNNGLYIQRGDDGAWESLTIGDAPMDGRMYARMNGMWVVIS